MSSHKEVEAKYELFYKKWLASAHVLHQSIVIFDRNQETIHYEFPDGFISDLYKTLIPQLFDLLDIKTSSGSNLQSYLTTISPIVNHICQITDSVQSIDKCREMFLSDAHSVLKPKKSELMNQLNHFEALYAKWMKLVKQYWRKSQVILPLSPMSPLSTTPASDRWLMESTPSTTSNEITVSDMPPTPSNFTQKSTPNMPPILFQSPDMQTISFIKEYQDDFILGKEQIDALKFLSVISNEHVDMKDLPPTPSFSPYIKFEKVEDKNVEDKKEESLIQELEEEKSLPLSRKSMEHREAVIFNPSKVKEAMETEAKTEAKSIAMNNTNDIDFKDFVSQIQEKLKNLQPMDQRLSPVINKKSISVGSTVTEVIEIVDQEQQAKDGTSHQIREQFLKYFQAPPLHDPLNIASEPVTSYSSPIEKVKDKNKDEKQETEIDEKEKRCYIRLSFNEKDLNKMKLVLLRIQNHFNDLKVYEPSRHPVFKRNKSVRRSRDKQQQKNENEKQKEEKEMKTEVKEKESNEDEKKMDETQKKVEALVVKKETKKEETEATPVILKRTTSAKRPNLPKIQTMKQEPGPQPRSFKKFLTTNSKSFSKKKKKRTSLTALLDKKEKPSDAIKQQNNHPTFFKMNEFLEFYQTSTTEPQPKPKIMENLMPIQNGHLSEKRPSVNSLASSSSSSDKKSLSMKRPTKTESKEPPKKNGKKNFLKFLSLSRQQRKEWQYEAAKEIKEEEDNDLMISGPNSFMHLSHVTLDKESGRLKVIELAKDGKSK